jgi:tape measure domain-containing protein
MGAFSGSLGSLYVEIGARISNFESAMARVSSQVDGAISNIDSKIKSIDFSALGGALTTAGTGLTAAITAPLALLGAASIKTASEMDSLTRGLIAVTGSSEQATIQLARLKDVAKLPGLGFEEAVRGSINLQAAGFSALEAENALRGFGNALATVGKGKADLDGVILALGQIASKGKISAEEINQLAERVPQIRKIMQQAFGTADTEILQKAGISAQEFVNKVTAELLKLPPVTGGIRNDFENFSDKLNQSLSAIGNNLAPIVTSVLAGLIALLDKVQSAAEWFGQLPQPIQAAALAIAGIATAAGPVLIVLGSLSSAIGSITALFSTGGLLAGMGAAAAGFTAWAAAIPLVLAALVALGVWVNSNWDSISAVVVQAWDGITDIWHAAWDPIGNWLTGLWGGIASAASVVWDPIANFFSTIWDGVGPYFSAAWEGIKGTLTGVWDGIKNAAASVWGGIVSVFQTFMEWAAKIPGANKLINLDDAWKSAQKASAEFKKTSSATEDLGKKANAAGGSGKPIPKLGKALKGVASEAKELDTKFKPLTANIPVLEAMARQLNAEFKKSAEEVAAAKIKLAELGDSMPTMITITDDLSASVAALSTDLLDVSSISGPAIKTSLDEMKEKSTELAAAFGTLGLKSVSEYSTVAAEAKKAYEVIAGSDVATPTDKNNAMLRMLKAQREAMVSNGEQIPTDMQAMIDKMDAVATNSATGMPKVTGAFVNFKTEVSTILTNLAQDISKSLWDGEGSWKEKGLNALKSIGQAITSSFIDPFTTAISGLISGAIADLLGGKGFGGIIDRVKEVGSAIGGVFGGASGAASSAGQAAGGAGRAGGAAGSAGSAGSAAGTAAGTSVTAIVGAVAGVASAISGIIGNFQSAKQETTLNAIEHNTRYSMMYLGERADGGILGRLFDIADKMQYVPTLLDGVNRKLDDWLAPAVQTLGLMQTDLYWSLRKLEDISSAMNWNLDSGRERNSLLVGIRDLLLSNRTPVINVYVNGVKQASDAVQMKMQGALAI